MTRENRLRGRAGNNSNRITSVVSGRANAARRIEGYAGRERRAVSVRGWTNTRLPPSAVRLGRWSGDACSWWEGEGFGAMSRRTLFARENRITVRVVSSHRVPRVTVVRQVPVGAQREVVLGPLQLPGQAVHPTWQRRRGVDDRAQVLGLDGERLLV